MTNSTIDPQHIDESSIYENGQVLGISVEELRGNDLAIRQLINNYNISQKNLKNKDEKVLRQEGEIEFLKTSPFIGAISLVLNVSSIIIIGIGINLLTASNQLNGVSWILIVIGGILSLISGLLPMLYPYIKKWFNTDRNSGNYSDIVNN